MRSDRPTACVKICTAQRVGRKMHFSTGPLFSARILEPNALTGRIVGWFTPRGVVALEG